MIRPYYYRGVDGYRGFGLRVRRDAPAVVHVGVFRWAGEWRVEVVVNGDWSRARRWRL